MRQAEALTRGRLIALLFAGALLSALLGAGCGGGEEEEASAAPTTRATFLERGNAICDRTYERVKAAYQAFVRDADGEPFSDIEEIEDYADTILIPAKETQVEELQALGLPRGDEAQVEAILAAYEEGIEKAEENARDAVTSMSGVFVAATDLAQAYGLKSCRY